MRYFYILLLLISTCTFSQEIPVGENEVIIEESIDDATEVPFVVIENVPIYSGCDQKLSNAALKKCMSTKISKHVSNNFNINIVNSLGLPDGVVRILVLFKIDKEGKVTDIKARAPHPELEKEVIRVIGLIPDMDKPGLHKGKPVIVPYSLPVLFNVDNSALSKRQKRKLKNRKKS